MGSVYSFYASKWWTWWLGKHKMCLLPQVPGWHVQWSSQATCKRFLCHLQLSGSLTWLSQISLWRITELPTSYKKVRMCNSKHTQLWNALYIGFYINNFTDQFINQKVGSMQNFMIDTWNGLWQTHLSLDKKNFENLGPFAIESLSNWILIHLKCIDRNYQVKSNSIKTNITQL